MKAFRYDHHGDLVPCPDYGEQFREPRSLPAPLAPRVPTSKRERRRMARRGRGPHRSRARRVVEVVSLRDQLATTVVTAATLRGHMYREGGGAEARLYLADDAKPTPDDDARMNAVARGRQQPGKPSRPLTPVAVFEVLRTFGYPRPDLITVSPDLYLMAREMFESRMYVGDFGVHTNPLAAYAWRIECDPTLPEGRWKITRKGAGGR